MTYSELISNIHEDVKKFMNSLYEDEDLDFNQDFVIDDELKMHTNNKIVNVVKYYAPLVETKILTQIIVIYIYVNYDIYNTLSSVDNEENNDKMMIVMKLYESSVYAFLQIVLNNKKIEDILITGSISFSNHVKFLKKTFKIRDNVLELFKNDTLKLIKTIGFLDLRGIIADVVFAKTLSEVHKQQPVYHENNNNTGYSGHKLFQTPEDIPTLSNQRRNEIIRDIIRDFIQTTSDDYVPEELMDEFLVYVVCSISIQLNNFILIDSEARLKKHFYELTYNEFIRYFANKNGGGAFAVFVDTYNKIDYGIKNKLEIASITKEDMLGINRMIMFLHGGKIPIQGIEKVQTDENEIFIIM